MKWKSVSKLNPITILVTVILYCPMNVLVLLAIEPLNIYPFEIEGKIAIVALSLLALLVSYVAASLLQRLLPKNLIKGEFARQTAVKVLLTLSIFLLTIFIQNVPYRYKSSSVILRILECLICPHYLLSWFSRGRDVILPIDLVFSQLIFALGFAYWYLVSSVIVWTCKGLARRLSGLFHHLD